MNFKIIKTLLYLFITFMYNNSKNTLFLYNNYKRNTAMYEPSDPVVTRIARLANKSVYPQIIENVKYP